MIQLIPAIDIIDGQCVRLTKGDYDSKKTYHNDPVAVAKMFEDKGFTRLHVVDLDGAKAHHVVNYKVLEGIASATHLTVDFGGGIKTDDDLRIASESGAQMMTIGSIAVTHPERFMEWLKVYGNRIILGADVRDGKVSINGWKEESQQELLPFLQRYVDAGVSNVLCTEISHDGMLQGPATALYQDIMAVHPSLHLIASGGVSGIDDIRQLHAAGIPAVVFGKAIYEGRIDLDALVQEFIH